MGGKDEAMRSQSRYRPPAGSCPGAGVAAAGAAAATVVPAKRRRARSLRGLLSVEPSGERQRPEAGRALQVTYPDDQAPGRPPEARRKGPWRGRARRRHRRLYDDMPAQGLSARLQFLRQDAELLRPLFALRLRKRRPGNLGHATQNLPQYLLRVDAKGDIYADGVDELIYGRLSNVLEG